MIGKILTSHSKVAWFCFTMLPLPPNFRNKEQRYSKKAYKNKRNNKESIKKAKLVPDLGTNKRT